MQDVLHAALFPESLTDAERGAVRRVLAEDAAARRAFTRVQALQAELGAALENTLPDRQALVLDALTKAGHGEALDADERARLRDASGALDADHSDLLGTLRRAMAADIEAFEQAWAEQPRATPRPTDPRTTAPKRVTRAPLARANTMRWAWRVGVGLAVVAFVAVSVLLVQRDASYVTVELAQGETRTLTLADGSTVKLLGGARLTYSDPEADAVFNRQVTLAGDAFFDVRPGTQAFVVRTGEAEVRVLGTAFGVRAADVATEVTLVEGRVLFAPLGAPARGVTLAQGQQSRLDAGAQVPTPPAAVEPGAVLAWTGLFFFADTPMRTVAATLTEGLGTAIAVAPALADEPVTGTFDRAQGAEQIVQALALTLGVQATRTATGWTLGP